MYKLPYFTEADEEKVIAFMKAHSFAVVTGFGGEYPVASHLPLHVELRSGKIFLTGHLMKNTDHHRAFERNEHVLAVFHGPHTYISASWYEEHAVASTWNYIAVHAKGRIRFTDEAGTYQAIRAITNKYEGNASAAAFDQLPQEYVARLMKAIVGFEIEVTDIDNVFKLSQNHGVKTRQSIIAQLLQCGDGQSVAIAALMTNLMEQSQG